MPGESGFEVARVIAAQRPGVKIVFISGRHAQELVVGREHVPLGARFLPKPFAKSGVIGVVSDLLCKREYVGRAFCQLRACLSSRTLEASILEFFRQLFAADFMAHVYCLREPSVIALHAISDALIALSYFLIPSALIAVVRRRRDLPFRWAYILFGIFIMACGTTHLLSVVTLSFPVYRLEGLVKALTALVSMSTAVLLIRLVPEAISIPGPEQFKHEIEERRRAEERIKALNAELESRVRERTLQLEAANAHLADLAGRRLDKAQCHHHRTGRDNRVLEQRRRSALWLVSRRSSRSQEPRVAGDRVAAADRANRGVDAAPAGQLEGGEFMGAAAFTDGSVIWVASYWASASGLPRGCPFPSSR